jgi:hypothetical protein
VHVTGADTVDLIKNLLPKREWGLRSSLDGERSLEVPVLHNGVKVRRELIQVELAEARG